MKNFLFKLLLGLLVLTGCSREDKPTIPVIDRDKGFDTPVTEKSENQEITYQFKDGVLVWNENSTQFIEKVVADTILYIKENAPKEMIPAVGDILSSRINEQLPYGLGNKVISVTKVDDTYKCVTTLAPLDELFEELVVHATIPLTESIVDGVYDTDGYFHPVKDAGRADIKLNPITFKLDEKLEGGSGVYKGMNATGEIEIGLSAVVDINLMEHTHEFSLTAEGGFFAGVEASYETPGKAKVKIIDVPKLFQSVVTIGPLVLRPFVDFSAGLVAGVEGSLKAGISKPFGMKVGVKDGFFFKENLLSDEQDNIITKLEWNAEGYAGVCSELGFGIGLYTTNLAVGLDPTLSALVNASFKMEMEDMLKVKPELGFNVLLDFDGYFTLDMGKFYNYRKQETFISWPLYKVSWPILPSLVPNSVTIEENKNADHLTFIAGYDYTGGLLSLFTDIKPIFRVYDDLGDAYCFTTDKKLTTVNEPQHFEFVVTGLQYDKDYTGKPGVDLFGLKFDDKGIKFKAESPEKEEDNNGGENNSGSEGSGNDDSNNGQGGGTPQEGCEACAAGHCHAHNYFIKKSKTYTGEATEITDNSAIVHGTFQGLTPEMEFGIVFYTDNGNENILKGTYNENNNEYAFSLKELSPDTEYNYMSYILVDNQYIYGERMNFSTLPKQFKFRFIAESSSSRFPDVNKTFTVESEDYFYRDIEDYSIEYSKEGDLEHAWDETKKSKIRICVADDTRNFDYGTYQGGDLLELWLYSNSFNEWFSPSLEVVYTVGASPVQRNEGENIQNHVKVKLEKLEE